MRVLALVTGALLALALVSFVPSAEAGPCTFKSPGCPGVVCLIVDGALVCAGDDCRYQSDCCPPGNLWCPEPPPDS